jgi:hypothetical protein
VNWRLAFSLSVCFVLLSSIAQPLALTEISEPQEPGSQLGFSSPEQAESLAILDPEAALDNHPELRELWDRQRYFFATVQWIEKTLGDVENALVALGRGSASSGVTLENLVKTAELRAENLENKFFDLFQLLERMDGFPALVVEGGEARWRRMDGQIDNEAKAWAENLLFQSHRLVDTLRMLQENMGPTGIADALERLAEIQELIGMALPTDTVNLEDLWFERWVRTERVWEWIIWPIWGRWVDRDVWERVTKVHQGDRIRVGVQLYNTNWLARGRTWLSWSGLGWGGSIYWDLAAAQRGTTYLLDISAPSPGRYKFSAWGRWEAWTCIFCIPVKIGEGEIPRRAITLEVRNRAPLSRVWPVEPREPRPWGTTFTYWVLIWDPDSHEVEVTLYRNGVRHGDVQRIRGVGMPTWTWTSTSADIGTHNYHFVVTDCFDTIRDPRIGAYPGPTVTKRGTSISMAAPSWVHAERWFMISGRLTGEFNEPVAGRALRLYRQGVLNRHITTDSAGHYSVMAYEWHPCTVRYEIVFGGDAYYEGSSRAADIVIKPPPPPPFDFRLEKLNDIVVAQGDSSSTTITVRLTSGSPQTVSLSGNWIGTPPTGATATLSPTSGFPTYNSTLVVTAAANASVGTFTYRVTGTGGGLTRTVDVFVTITDTIPPGNWRNFSPTGWIRDPTPTCSVEVRDGGSGLNVGSAQYRYSNDDGASWSLWLPATSTGTDGTTKFQTVTALNVPFNRDSITPTWNRVQFRIRDMAGNLGTSPEYYVLIDSTPPDTSLIPHAPDPTNSPTPTYRGTATDVLNVVDNIEYRVDRGPWRNVDPFTPARTVHFTFTTPALKDGIRTIEARARDSIGNWDTTPALDVLLVDTVPPFIPGLVSPPNGTFTNDNTPRLKWTSVTDNTALTTEVSGVSHYRLQVDNDPDFSSPEINITTTDNRFDIPAPGLVDENYSWRVRAVDNASNVSDWSPTWTFVIDTIPPQVPPDTLTVPNGGEVWYGGEVHNIMWDNVKIVDPHLSPTPISLYYSLDGGLTWTLIATNEPNDGTHAWTVPPVNSRTARVKIVATDLAGNENWDQSDADFTIATPDLKIGPGDISARRLELDRLRITADVHNLGLRAAQNVVVRFVTPWGTADEVIWRLDPRGTVSVRTDWPWPGAGEHVVTVTADPDGAILEENEANNSATVTIVIGANGQVSVSSCSLHPDFSEVHVAFSNAFVYRDGWRELVVARQTVELVQFHETGLYEVIGSGRLASGHYSRVKLVIEGARGVLKETGEIVEFDIPSPEFVASYKFEITPDELTNVVVYFDLERSILETPEGHKFVPVLLKAEKVLHSFEVEVTPPTQIVGPNLSAVSKVTVYNTGTAEGTYDLSFASEIEQNWIELANEVTAPAGGSVSTPLRITVPENHGLHRSVIHPYIIFVDLTFRHASVIAFAPGAEAEGEIWVDVVPPESSVNPIGPYWQNAGMVPFEVTAAASDDLSGVSSVELYYRYSPDNSAWGPWVKFAVDTEEAWSWQFNAPDGDGYYEFYSIATDVALNMEAVPEQADLNLGVDTTPPVSSVNVIEPYWQNAGMVPFEVTAAASDPIPPSGAVPSGIKQVELYYRYSLDNAAWGSWTPYGIDADGSDGWSWVFVPPLGDGYYEFYTVATDVALNVEATPDVLDARVGVDTMPPVSSVDQIELYWHNASMLPIEVTATASDRVPPSGAVPSGLERIGLYYRYSPDNLRWGPWTLYGVDGENTDGWSWVFDPPLGDGYYELYSIATDVALNVEAAPERPDERVGIDTTPPTSSVNPIEPYWREGLPFEVSVTATDNWTRDEMLIVGSGVARVELYYRSSIDNVDWTEWRLFGADDQPPYSWSFDAPDGYALYEFYSVATDVVSNVESPPEEADARCGVVIPATIDIDPDTLNLNSDDDDEWVTAYIELPPGYGVAHVREEPYEFEMEIDGELTARQQELVSALVQEIERTLATVRLEVEAEGGEVEVEVEGYLSEEGVARLAQEVPPWPPKVSPWPRPSARRERARAEHREGGRLGQLPHDH